MPIRECVWHEPSTLKDGRQGKGFVECRAPYSVVNTCQMCGRLGGAHYVTTRNDVYGWHRTSAQDFTPSIDLLCFKCWQKVRTLLRRKRVIDQVNRLIWTLKRSKPDGQQS